MFLKSENTQSLLPHWLVCLVMVIFLIAYNVVCHYWAEDIKIDMEEQLRVFIRTVLYVTAIVLFPLTNLMRHILLRLNQTMPGDKSAQSRYLLTIIVTQCMVETIGVFGPVMFVLGDDFNTLYIFTLLAGLGVILHRPRDLELLFIERALTEK